MQIGGKPPGTDQDFGNRCDVQHMIDCRVGNTLWACAFSGPGGNNRVHLYHYPDHQTQKSRMDYLFNYLHMAAIRSPSDHSIYTKIRTVFIIKQTNVSRKRIVRLPLDSVRPHTLPD